MQNYFSLCMNHIKSNESDCINSSGDYTSTLCEDVLTKYCIAEGLAESWRRVGLDLEE